jgi:hypothetical protein
MRRSVARANHMHEMTIDVLGADLVRPRMSHVHRLTRFGRGTPTGRICRSNRPVYAGASCAPRLVERIEHRAEPVEVAAGAAECR